MFIQLNVHLSHYNEQMICSHYINSDSKLVLFYIHVFDLVSVFGISIIRISE